MLKAAIDPVTNRQDWVDQCEVRDEDDNGLVDLTDAVIVLSVRDRNSKETIMTAKTDDGTIVVQGPGIFEFTFTLTQMRTLEVSKAYDVGCTVVRNDITQQFFIGAVPVLDGIVP